MIIEDSFYGMFEVEPVIEALIQTKAVQRLKGIYQGGASYLVNPKWNVTRYDHSIGTMLLIRQLGGCLEEQIAGLLHDVSHTAFSHVVDFALQNDEQDYHERIYEKIIAGSEIPTIFKRYGLDEHQILFDESRWTILEQAAPKLCADRIDYTLRDLYHDGAIKKEEIATFLNSLDVVNDEIVVNNIAMGEWFVKTYYQEVIDYFMHPLNVYGYDVLSKAIKLGLELDELKVDDLMMEDHDVYTILKTSKSKDILSLMNALNDEVQLVEDCLDYDIYQKQKLRLIDPTLKVSDRVCKMSERSDKVISLSAAALEKANRGIYIKIIK